MMKYLKLGLDIFCKNIKKSILIVLQLMLMIIVINYAISSIETLRTPLRIFENVQNNNFIIVMPTMGYNYRDNNYLNLSKIKGEYTLARSRTTFIDCVEFDMPIGATLFAYDGLLFNNLKVPLLKGEWTDKIIIEDGLNFYPIVVNQEDINRKILKGCRFNATTAAGIEISFYIAGVLSNKQTHISLGQSSNVPDASMFFDKKPKDFKFVFYINSDVLPDIFDEAEFYTQPVQFLFFDEKQEKNVIDDDILKIKDQALVFDYDTVLSNSQKSYKETSSYYLPICICLVAISLIGMISSTALNTLENSYYFSILYLCGGIKSGFKYICLGYVGVISAFALAISLLINSFLQWQEVYQKIMFDLSFSNIIITAFSLLTIIIVSMLIPIRLLKKFSVSEFIRNFSN